MCNNRLADARATGECNVDVFHVSAFVPGSIYVAAANAVEVRKLVESLPDVFSNHQFEFIPQDDVTSLRRIRPFRLAAGSWVRVTGKGRYRNDICNVIESNEADQMATVLLVPRTNSIDGQPSSKGKGKGARRLRPVAQLFRPDPSARGFESIGNGRVKFNGQEYMDGLLVHTLHSKKLRHGFPTVVELELFGQSASLDASLIYRTWTLCDAVTLSQSDRVRIVEGEQAGSVGKILNVRDGFFSIISSEKPGEPVLEVPLANVRSHFVIGDYVLVKAGKYAGKFGGVTNVERKHATDDVTFIAVASAQTSHPEQVK